ncbi:uncharacterized protein EV420DRAFT_684762 [Desarmillaria tabescens]|uniref:Uncharacterized protein n=1 Tax=Armillaria tabescens TaxID=1929756 RepID=A0AA39IZD7_ARMTA|nr:uncharacterized protein EV420DRAFT_684762 [Desarmillaria tabescens]KAK0432476.1 hypothetical protein EV420DRAFT_684762 [Desarmillaria tabescens]
MFGVKRVYVAIFAWAVVLGQWSMHKVRLVSWMANSMSKSSRCLAANYARRNNIRASHCLLHAKRRLPLHWHLNIRI